MAEQEIAPKAELAKLPDAAESPRSRAEANAPRKPRGARLATQARRATGPVPASRGADGERQAGAARTGGRRGTRASSQRAHRPSGRHRGIGDLFAKRKDSEHNPGETSELEPRHFHQMSLAFADTGGFSD